MTNCRNSICFLFYALLSAQVFGQLPETDIFISEVTTVNGKLVFSEPLNITHRKGYDNQPYFMPDGKSLMYVAWTDTIQSDIYKYEFDTKKITAITRTSESEYSPALSPDEKNLCVVRVDSDKGQRFYTMPVSGTTEVKRMAGTDSIGYYCWLDDSTLAMFILGNAMTLQSLDMKTGKRTLISSDVGRCLKRSPDGKKLYFVIKQNENEWSVFSYDRETKTLDKVVATLPKSEDFTLLPDGSFLMGSKGKLYRFVQQDGEGWTELADFSATLGDFYRISINSKGDKLALVAFTGDKP